MRGFTLVEVMIALVVVQVGLLGVVGIMWLALRTTERAWALEVGTSLMEEVADSLGRASGEPGAGSRALPAGSVTWTVSESGLFVIRFTSPQDSVTVTGQAPSG